ncbi:hypothetical protein KXD40_001155 [Peronospora effusa]|nr:hypothetical protein KXD40_001155 [Peronospora effusa]
MGSVGNTSPSRAAISASTSIVSSSTPDSSLKTDVAPVFTGAGKAGGCAEAASELTAADELVSDGVPRVPKRRPDDGILTSTRGPQRVSVRRGAGSEEGRVDGAGIVGSPVTRWATASAPIAR